MARARADFNIQRRVSVRGGWLALGISLGSEIRKTLVELNDDGYSVALVIPDRPSPFWHLGQVFLAIVTLGFVYGKAGVIIIGERIPTV